MRTAVEVWLAWARWWPVDALGKGLAGAPARVLPGRLLSSPARRLPGALWSSSVVGSRQGSSSPSAYLILNVFTKICMPPWGCLPNPCPMGAVDSRVICSVGVGRVAAARVLSGLLKLSPGKDLAGGVRFVPFVLHGLGLGVVLVPLSFSLT